MDELIQFAYLDFSENKGIPLLPHETVENIRKRLSLTASAFFDYFARRVAHDYLADRLSFIVADCAMNSLYHYCLAQYDVILPSYANEVYIAFDQGEFHHSGDDDSIDPEIQYTKPIIQSLVIRDVVLGEGISP